MSFLWILCAVDTIPCLPLVPLVPTRRSHWFAYVVTVTVTVHLSVQPNGAKTEVQDSWNLSWLSSPSFHQSLSLFQTSVVCGSQPFLTCTVFIFQTSDHFPVSSNGFNPKLLALTCILIYVLLISQPFNVYNFLAQSCFCSGGLLTSQVLQFFFFHSLLHPFSSLFSTQSFQSSQDLGALVHLVSWDIIMPSFALESWMSLCPCEEQNQQNKQILIRDLWNWLTWYGLGSNNGYLHAGDAENSAAARSMRPDLMLKAWSVPEELLVFGSPWKSKKLDFDVNSSGSSRVDEVSNNNQMQAGRKQNFLLGLLSIWASIRRYCPGVEWASPLQLTQSSTSSQVFPEAPLSVECKSSQADNQRLASQTLSTKFTDSAHHICRDLCLLNLRIPCSPRICLVT